MNATDRSASNYVLSLQVKSNAADNADVILWADPTTHRLLVDASVSITGLTAVDDSAFVAGTGTGVPMMGFATADSVDSGDVGVLAMTTARALHVYIKGTDVAAGGTSMVDDAAFTPAVTSITPIGAMFDDVAPDSVNEGDGGVVRMSANRNLYVTLRDAAGNERGLNIDANGALPIGSIVPGTAATNLGKAEDVAHTTGDTGVMALAVRSDAGSPLAGDGDYIPIMTDSGGAIWTRDRATQIDDAAFTPGTGRLMSIGFFVDDTATDSVDEGDAGIPRMSADRIIYVQGALANDAVDAGNPLKIGGRASGAPISAVAANDRVDAFFDLQGRQVIVMKAATGTQTTVASSATNVTLLAANAARLGATIYNDSTALLYVRLQATATTSNFTVKMQGDDYYEVPAGYTGIIDGIWASATGNARITEIT